MQLKYRLISFINDYKILFVIKVKTCVLFKYAQYMLYTEKCNNIS